MNLSQPTSVLLDRLCVTTILMRDSGSAEARRQLDLIKAEILRRTDIKARLTNIKPEED